MSKDKLQIPIFPAQKVRYKSQTNPSFQIRIANFGIVISVLFVICNLYIGICPSFAQEEFKYDAKGKHNPFIPWVTPDGRFQQLEKEEVKGDIVVDGIIYDKHGVSYALVNAEVVTTGDYVGSYQVLKIEENKVIFIKEGQVSEIELEKEE